MSPNEMEDISLEENGSRILLSQPLRKIPRLPDIAEEPNAVSPEFSFPQLRRSPRTLYSSDVVSGSFKTSTPAHSTKLRRANKGEGSELPVELDFSVDNIKFKDQESAKDELIRSLMGWRHEALENHLYETAIFWGNKLLMVRSDAVEAYELAEIYFTAGHYQLGLQLALAYDLPKLSLRGRILVARCQLALGNTLQAAETIGEERDRGPGTEDYDEESFRLRSIESFLRGKIFITLGHKDVAKKSFLEALDFDLRCYEALHWLSIHHLLTPEEEESLSSNFVEHLLLNPAKPQLNQDQLQEPKEQVKEPPQEQIEELPQQNQVQLQELPQPNQEQLEELPQLSQVQLQKLTHLNENQLQTKQLPNQEFLPNKTFDLSLQFLDSSTHFVRPDSAPPTKRARISIPKEENSLILNTSIKPTPPKISQSNLKFICATYCFQLPRSQVHLAEKALFDQFALTHHWDALAWGAQHAYSQGNLYLSYQLLTELRSKDVTNLDCLPLLASVLLELGYVHQLDSLSRELEEHHHDHQATLYIAGLVLQAKEQPKLARAQLWACCQKFPNFVPAWLNYGHLSSDLNGAIRAYSTALRLQPSSGEPLLHLARCYRQQTQYQLAERYLQRSAQLGLTHCPHLANERGLLKYAIKDYPAAIAALRQGLEFLTPLRPSDNRSLQECLWTNLGHCYRKAWELPRARLCFLNALALQPQSALATAGLGMVTQIMDASSRYVDLYHRALLLDPESYVVKALLTQSLYDHVDFCPNGNDWDGLITFDKSSVLDAILPPPPPRIPPSTRPIPASATHALGLNTSEAPHTLDPLPSDEAILETTIS